MKRIGNLWSKICELENLRRAHECAQKDKKYYKEVKMVNENPDFYLKEIQKILLDGSYKVTADCYEVLELLDKGKVRELWKLNYYPHRIIQWAVMLQVESIFTRVFCEHTCASIVGRGEHRAHELLENYLKDKQGTKYCLKIDIRKFYPNVDHEILKALLRKVFKDQELLRFLDMIVDSIPKGIPIGSYLSQFLANFYLAYFDHFVKEDLKIKAVIRYMDDVVVLGESTEYLRDIFNKIQNYLRARLKLEIKENWQIFLVESRGIDFVGYRFFHEYILLRKTTLKKFKARVQRVLERQNKNQLISQRDFCSINSYLGWLKWCDSYRIKQKYLIPILPALKSYYMNTIHGNKTQAEREKLGDRYITHLIAA